LRGQRSRKPIGFRLWVVHTAIMLLESAKLKDQYAFLTFKAIKELEFKEAKKNVG